MEYIQFIITIILILLIFWMADSQKKKQDKKLKEMQDNIKINDKIITYSGLSGKVKDVLEDKVIINVNPSEIEISIEKWAIAGVEEETSKKEN